MDVLAQLADVLEVMEAPKPGVEHNSKDLFRTNELIRVSILLLSKSVCHAREGF